MNVFLVILLIVIGISLIVVEVVVLPGITIAGIGGVVLTAAGVYFAFRFFGQKTGVVTLLATSLMFVAFLAYALRAKTWTRLSLKSEIDGKVNVREMNIRVGDRAVTVSRLAPMGKISFNGQFMEAKSEMGLIDEGRNVEVTQVNASSVTVQEISS